jgi:hypothetical protein
MEDTALAASVPIKPAPKPRSRAKKPTAAAVKAEAEAKAAATAAAVAMLSACFEGAAEGAGDGAATAAAVAPGTKQDKAAALARARRHIAETNYTQRLHELAVWAKELAGDTSEDGRLRTAQRLQQWRHAADNAELYIAAHVERLVWNNLPAAV